MKEKLQQYMDSLFADAPQTARMSELKEEMLQNLMDKYHDLIEDGKSEESAYDIAVTSIGDVRALIAEQTGGIDEEAKAQASKRSAAYVAVAVGLYITAVVPIILIGGKAGVVLMFIMVAIATGLLIYNGASRPRYVKSDDTVVEEFKAWKEQKKRKDPVKSAIQRAMWLIIVCLYMAISFSTGAWHITWIVFLIGSAISLIISGIWDVKG